MCVCIDKYICIYLPLRTINFTRSLAGLNSQNSIF